LTTTPGSGTRSRCLLQEAGYEVVAEGDPEEALRRAGAEAFDLILCDVRMPKMDGLTFLGRYRAGPGAALLIMMSAYGNEDAAIAPCIRGRTTISRSRSARTK
jgi:Response regulator containing CheY-like receiver, AAA-type ATPase, and DNA-binding domains